MIQDFVIDVTTGAKGVTQQGFGTILVLANDIEQEYVEIEDMKDLRIDSETATFKLISTIFAQSPKPSKIALVGTVAEGIQEQVELFRSVMDKDFYFVVTTDNSIELVKAISEIVGGMHKTYFATINDAEVENDILLENVMVAVHDDKTQRVAEGMAPIMADKIGGKTAKFKTVEGVKVPNFDTTTINEITKKYFNTYIERLGLRYFTEGYATSGEFIDVTLGKHWVMARLEEDLLQHFVNTDNVDYTNDGISELIDVVEQRMKLAIDQGIFSEYEISYKKRQEIPVSEVASRKYNYLQVEGTLKGAIHGAKIRVFMVL